MELTREQYNELLYRLTMVEINADRANTRIDQISHYTNPDSIKTHSKCLKCGGCINHMGKDECPYGNECPHGIGQVDGNDIN